MYERQEDVLKDFLQKTKMRIFNSLEGMENGLQKEEMSYTGEVR